jgi:hypothetical protein
MVILLRKVLGQVQDDASLRFIAIRPCMSMRSHLVPAGIKAATLGQPSTKTVALSVTSRPTLAMPPLSTTGATMTCMNTEKTWIFVTMFIRNCLLCINETSASKHQSSKLDPSPMDYEQLEIDAGSLTDRIGQDSVNLPSGVSLTRAPNRRLSRSSLCCIHPISALDAAVS